MKPADPLLDRLMVVDRLDEEAERAAELARTDGEILEGWRRGFNTQQIAEYQRVPESVVANRLAKLRDARFRN
jgi:hypothetical protein